MQKWLCYDEDAVFYVKAGSREEAEAVATLHDGLVVCPVNEMDENKAGSLHEDSRQ